jgi:hypothetical protein
MEVLSWCTHLATSSVFNYGHSLDSWGIDLEYFFDWRTRHRQTAQSRHPKKLFTVFGQVRS